MPPFLGIILKRGLVSYDAFRKNFAADSFRRNTMLYLPICDWAMRDGEFLMRAFHTVTDASRHFRIIDYDADFFV